MKSIKSAIIVLLFAAIVAGVYMFLVGDLKFEAKAAKGNGLNNTGFLETEEDFRDKLAELRMDQIKMQKRKLLMVERKQAIVKELKDKGITSTSNIADKDVKFKVSNLKTAVKDIKVVDKSIEKYQQGIDAIEAMLTRLEQERLSGEVSISKEKAEELGIILLDVEDKLIEEDNILEEEALRELLGLELGE